MPSILTLDLATHVGYASLLDGEVTSGMKDFSKSKKPHYGHLFADFNTWLRTLPKYDIYVVERSFMRYRKSTEIGFGMYSRVQEYAYMLGKEFHEASPKTIKKFISGNGDCDKEPIIQWFQKTFHRDPITDDESDAMALLYFFCNTRGMELQ